MERPYHILYLSSWYPSRIEPSNGNFVQRHAEAAAQRHHVEVLHAIGDIQQKQDFVFDEQNTQGVRVLTVYYRSSPNALINFFRRMSAYRCGFKKMAKPDLVHANIMRQQMLFVLWLKFRLGIPFVVSEHWSAFLPENVFQLSVFQKVVARIISRFASRLLPVSKALENGLKINGIKGEFSVVPNVVNTHVFSVDEERKADIVFLHISNLAAVKHSDVIVRNLVKLRHEGYPVKLEIGGDGDIRPLLEQVKELDAGDYINVFPAISQKEVAEKMSHSDCFVLFSDFETQSCVLIESLSSGKPVIAPRVGGIPEFVNNGNGILIARGNEDQLYQAMKRVASKETNFLSARDIRRQVQRFSVPAVSAQLSEIYTSVLQKNTFSK